MSKIDFRGLRAHTTVLLDNTFVPEGAAKNDVEDILSIPASIQTILSGIMDAYKEALVDASVYDFLGYETWEYLSAFLYENETPVINVISPLAPHVVLRFGAVLRTCDNEASQEKAWNLLFEFWMDGAQRPEDA